MSTDRETPLTREQLRAICQRYDAGSGPSMNEGFALLFTCIALTQALEETLRPSDMRVCAQRARGLIREGPKP